MRLRMGTVHYIAECLECDFSTQDYIDGQQKTGYHARKTGHKIHVERGSAGFYNEK